MPAKRTPASKRPQSWRLATGLAAMVAGVGLLAGAAVVTWKTFHPEPLYRYELAAADQTADAVGDDGKPSLRHGRVVAMDSDRELATFEMAESASGPVLMKWSPRVDAPFLSLVPDPDEVGELAAVLARHVPEDRPVLAWWDTSRQLQQFAPVTALFDQHLSQPLFVPAAWKAGADQVRATESAFWQGESATVEPADQQQFQDFADALLMDEGQGMSALQRLAGGQPAVLVLHIRDVLMLGQMAPDKLGVAFKRFSEMGDLHGTVSGVRDWLKRNDYAAYSIMRAGSAGVHAIALTDDDSAATLVARLLPFIGNDQHDVMGARLVYRTGEFIVYEIEPDTQASAQSGDLS